MASGGTVLIGAIVNLVIIGCIGFLFFVLVVVMLQVRRHQRKTKMHKILDPSKNDQLKISEKHLGSMYERCKGMWDLASRLQPIPEKGTLPRGWTYSPDGNPINIRDAIAESPAKLFEAVAALGDKFERKQWQTVSQLLTFLLQKRVGTLKKEDCDIYIGFYHSAKFGKPNFCFELDDYARFLAVFDALLSSIKP